MQFLSSTSIFVAAVQLGEVAIHAPASSGAVERRRLPAAPWQDPITPFRLSSYADDAIGGARTGIVGTFLRASSICVARILFSRCGAVPHESASVSWS